VEAQRVLLHHLEPRALEQRERGGIGHVGMQHAGRARVGEVDARVDVEGGLLVFPIALEHLAGAVQRKEVPGCHFAPVQPVAIEKKTLAIGQHHAEVVADPFVQVQPHRQAERRREVDAHGALDRRVLQLLHGSHGSRL
jgi:hypothetical protein